MMAGRRADAALLIEPSSRRSSDGVEAITPQLSKSGGVVESARLSLSSPAPDLDELMLDAKLRVPTPRGGS